EPVVVRIDGQLLSHKTDRRIVDTVDFLNRFFHLHRAVCTVEDLHLTFFLHDVSPYHLFTSCRRLLPRVRTAGGIPTDGSHCRIRPATDSASADENSVCLLSRIFKNV